MNESVELARTRPSTRVARRWRRLVSAVTVSVAALAVGPLASAAPIATPTDADVAVAIETIDGVEVTSLDAGDAPVAAASDVTGPVLVSSDVTVSHTSFAEGPVVVTTRVHVTDATGVEAPTLVLSHVGTQQSAGFGTMSLVEGTAEDGVWERVATIPVTAAPGQWEVILYPLEDVLGNQGTTFQTLKTVTITGDPGDVTGPVLVSSEVSMNHSSFAEGPVEVTVRAHVTDESGVEAPIITVTHLGTSQSYGFGAMTLVEGTAEDGVWERVATIPVTAAPGQWEVILYPLEDVLGNQGTTFQTLKTVTITGDPGDVTGPVLVSSEVSMNHSSFAEGPVEVTVRAHVTDESGVEAPIITVTHLGTSQSYGFGAMTLVEGTAEDGVWERVATIPVTAAPGQWEVTLYPLKDVMGNTSGGFRTLKTITINEHAELVAPTVSISGDVVVGATVAVANGSAEDFTPVADSVSYQWLRDGTVISGATSASYSVVAGDAGKKLSVRVTGVKAGYSEASATSAVKTVGVGSFSKIAVPTISGDAVVGKSVSVAGAAKSDFTPVADSVSYQWLRDGSVISGATSASYSVVAGDAGKKLSVRVTGVKAGYSEASVTSASVLVQYPQNAWLAIDGSWYYFNGSRQKAKGWLDLKGTWYFLNQTTGAMQTGWVKDGKAWYHMAASGAMQKGWTKVGTAWFYLNGSGVMQTGWLSQGGRWYYLDGSGAMRTGWTAVGSSWYYMNGDGIMQTGWLKQGSSWYYLDGGGKMLTGWARLGGSYYFFNGSGVMQTGWLSQGGRWYYLDGSGAMRTGWTAVGSSWYYLDSSGAMRTGWLQQGSTWYYLRSDGSMATGTVWVDGRQSSFSSSGKWNGYVTTSTESVVPNPVTPGAFCANDKRGWIGYTVTGMKMVCSGPLGETPRWRAY